MILTTVQSNPFTGCLNIMFVLKLFMWRLWFMFDAGPMPFLQLQNVLRVRNGFNSDWMPSGYRDVKLSPVVNEHLCEIQLHLSDFYSLKDGQHEVYEWARELKVTTELSASYLLQNLSSEVMAEMIRLSQRNWRGTADILPSLHKAAGNFLQAQEGFSEVA